VSNQLDTLYNIIISDPGKLRAFEDSPDFNYSLTQQADIRTHLLARGSCLGALPWAEYWAAGVSVERACAASAGAIASGPAG
jgi:hypothetical protein